MDGGYEQKRQVHLKAHVIGHWDAIKQTGDAFTDHKQL